MKHLIAITLISLASGAGAQINTPQPSPSATVKQTVGLTEVELNYSRPHRRGRDIFGDLVPYDKMWRTGANKNAMISTCLLYTSPSPRDATLSRMPSSA